MTHSDTATHAHSSPLAGRVGTSRADEAPAPARDFYSDTTEALANAVIGLVVSWAATFFVLGFSPSQSAAITAMFFGLSFTRAWLLRRFFRGRS